MCVYQAQAAGESEEVVMTTTSTITILLPCIPSPQHRRERATKLQEKVICFQNLARQTYSADGEMRLFAKFLLLLVEATRSDAGRGLRFLQSTCPSTAADFGVVSGAISLLEFEYEVEYNRFDYRIGDILDVLEPKFVAFLLPTIFGTDCNGEGRDGQMSKYIGVSASPTDSPLGTTTCNQPVSVEGRRR